MPLVLLRLILLLLVALSFHPVFPPGPLASSPVDFGPGVAPRLLSAVRSYGAVLPEPPSAGPTGRGTVSSPGFPFSRPLRSSRASRTCARVCGAEAARHSKENDRGRPLRAPPRRPFPLAPLSPRQYLLLPVRLSVPLSGGDDLAIAGFGCPPQRCLAPLRPLWRVGLAARIEQPPVWCVVAMVAVVAHHLA